MGIGEDSGKDVFPLAPLSSSDVCRPPLLPLALHHIPPALHLVTLVWKRLPAPPWCHLSWTWCDQWSHQALNLSNASTITPQSYGQCWEVVIEYLNQQWLKYLTKYPMIIQFFFIFLLWKVLFDWSNVLHPCQLQQVQPSPQPPWRPTFRGDLSQIPAKVGFPLASCLKASPVPGPDWAGQLWDPEDWRSWLHDRDQRLLHREVARQEAPSEHEPDQETLQWSRAGKERRWF